VRVSSYRVPQAFTRAFFQRDFFMNRQPSVFISHGAPTFALEPGVLGPKLAALGKTLTDVKAVLVVSPHWETRGLRITAVRQPETIHDFGGFPAELYTLQYPTRGAPELAQAAAQLLRTTGYDAVLDYDRGLDHGAWVPLMHLFPEAGLPVMQVSMPWDLDATGALSLGAALAPLRDRGVLVIGSGSLTHNLFEFRQHNPADAPYAHEFAAWARDKVLRKDTASLVDYRRRAPHAERAHPSQDHYLPLLVALGASNATDVPAVIEGGMTYGMISMDSFVWG
jgi:4,5-DOPA dioxygenase extradiol